MANRLDRTGGALVASCLVLLLTACSRCAEPQTASPPPAHLSRVPDGYGEPWSEGTVLQVRARRLVLPSGRACSAGDGECTAALAALRGERLALDLDRGLLMADLSEPLALLAQALEPGEQACLLAADTSSVRCLPFRPFSGEQFSAWLDAPRPLGKIRVVMRSDGMEVVADRGKVPGPDRFGPSLPPKKGKPDFEGLDPLARALAHRFDDEEAAIVPSARTRLEHAARALAAFSGVDAERFPRTFLVYP